MKMGTNYLAILGVTTVTTVMSCTTAKKEYMSYELYPVRTGSLIEMEYTPEATKFTLWSPTADEVRLMLYEAGEGGHAYEIIQDIRGRIRSGYRSRPMGVQPHSRHRASVRLLPSCKNRQQC